MGREVQRRTRANICGEGMNKTADVSMRGQRHAISKACKTSRPNQLQHYYFSTKLGRLDLRVNGRNDACQ